MNEQILRVGGQSFSGGVQGIDILKLGGEENTARIWFDFPYQSSPGHSILKVSTVHNNIDHILTFGCPAHKYREGLKKVLESFKFS